MVNPSWGSFQTPNQKMHAEQKKEIQPIENEMEQEIPGGLIDSQKPEGEKPDWGNFQSPTTYQGEPDQTEQENLLDYTIRNISANASRLGEQFLGRYGNVEKMGKDFLTHSPMTGGIIGWALSELLGKDNWETLVKGKPGNQQILPTSQQLKETSERLTSGYTKPTTKGEEKFQGFTEDVGATISGRAIRNPTARNIGLNNLLIPAAANVTKEIVEDLGLGKDKANLAKMAVWLPLSLASNVNAPQYAANLMNQGRNGFNQNVVANVPRYQNRMNQVSRNMLQGDPRSALAQQQLSGINNDISNGQTSMRDLMNRYDSINAAKRSRDLFSLSPGDKKSAIRNINQVRDAVREEIRNLGQINPKALKDWENGVQAFSTIHRSKAITNWIKGIAKGPYAKILTAPAAGIFGIGGYGGFKAPLISGTGAVALPQAYKTGQTLYRMWKDPNLSKYYWGAISAAQKENIPAFINNYEKLNRGIGPIKKKSKSQDQ